MPTGTGKIETMLALFAQQAIERLLVVVPSDALRAQVAGKFETYGVLQEFGVIARHALRPVVGQVRHEFTTVDAAEEFADACSVGVATPNALNASAPEARAAFVQRFSHLFVDEAHHVAAATWRAVRVEFAGKPVVQFTATPFREITTAGTNDRAIVGDVVCPAVSPDGTRIAFNRTESAGYFTVDWSLLMVMRADGRDKHALVG